VRRARRRRLRETLARQQELIGRAAEQRRALSGHAAAMAPALARGDAVLGWGRALVSKPIVILGVVALVVALRPRAAFAAASRALAWWGAWSALHLRLTGLAAPRSLHPS
jgi:hypothetical protein